MHCCCRYSARCIQASERNRGRTLRRVHFYFLLQLANESRVVSRNEKYMCVSYREWCSSITDENKRKWWNRNRIHTSRTHTQTLPIYKFIHTILPCSNENAHKETNTRWTAHGSHSLATPYMTHHFTHISRFFFFTRLLVLVLLLLLPLARIHSVCFPLGAYLFLFCDKQEMFCALFVFSSLFCAQSIESVVCSFAKPKQMKIPAEFTYSVSFNNFDGSNVVKWNS